jgi:hypothetical protein
MERTIVSLEPRQKQALAIPPQRTGTSFASLVRQAIDTYLVEKGGLEPKVAQLEILSRHAEESIRHMIERIEASNAHVDRVLDEANRLRRARGAEEV